MNISVYLIFRMKIEKRAYLKTIRSRIMASISLAIITLMMTLNAQAQFHQKGANSNTAQRPAASNVDMRGWKYGEMDARDPAVWGRSIFHPNGNYTESKLDEAQQTLQQHTYRAKGKDSDKSILVQKRMIRLNAAGRATEVLIYDSAGRLTNRGTLFYDSVGRLSEERLFDTNNQMVRRKIQTYAQNGQKMPLRTFKYGKGLADDVDLLITPESVQKEGAAEEAKAKKKKGSFLKKLRFWKKKEDR